MKKYLKVSIYRLVGILVAFFVGVSFLNAENSNPSGSNEIEEPLNEEVPYECLFQDGRSWIAWHGLAWNGSETHEFIKVVVVGDKIVEDIPCKVLKVEFIKLSPNGCWNSPDRADFPEYIYAYEKNRKIFIYRENGPYYIKDEIGREIELKYGEPYFDLYVDLNLTVGDSLKFGETILNDFVSEYGGSKHRTLELKFATPGVFPESFWIEGIGSNNLSSQWKRYSDPKLPTATTSCEQGLVMCCQDGEPIYDNRKAMLDLGINLDVLTSIDEVLMNTECSSYYYNLQGVKILQPHKGEIYIHNGKKILY